MSERFSAADERYMRQALALAMRGQGAVEPNPMVGCVLVRGGRVVGDGWHRKFAGPHAEVEALRAAAGRARGATAYVTLEPCCHFGKTPPCTDALIAAGVSRVVAAMRDPFPKVRGRGQRLLRAAGIDVRMGLCEAEAMRLNGPYLKRQKTGRPWVILKWAQSLDGKIATRTGDSKWISGEASRTVAHEIRGYVDAVIVGVGTVLADDPLLTCRHGRPRRAATRVVLDPHLRTPAGARLVKTARQAPTLIVTDRRLMESAALQRLVRGGAEVIGLPAARGRFELGTLLDELGAWGMTNVMVEGGGKTLGAFWDAGLADEAVVFVAPRLIGGAEARSALSGVGPARMRELRTSIETSVTSCEEDLVYRLVYTSFA
jgi:diaminohydroxyphosphoribosylaminopyrimidine deaminase / 5-amino-6-(5-phosphoribosylamino)uracil reductase